MAKKRKVTKKKVSRKRVVKRKPVKRVPSKKKEAKGMKCIYTTKIVLGVIALALGIWLLAVGYADSRLAGGIILAVLGIAAIIFGSVKLSR